MVAEEQANQAKPKLIKTQLITQGPALPLGVLGPDGGIHKDLVVKPWRMKEERELGAIRDANRDANLAEYVSMVLGAMCTRLGPHNFEDQSLKPEQKRLIIGQMYAGDVFYAYVWLRTQTLGNEIALNLKCPRCQKSVDGFVADINTVDVHTCSSVDESCWEYELKTPIKIRGDVVTHLKLGPAHWNAMEMLNGAGLGMAKPAMLKASIKGLGRMDDAKQVVLTDSDLDELTKRDIEAIIKQINDNNIGPNMAVDGKCKQCGHEFRLPIDWGYDSFFGDSSQ